MPRIQFIIATDIYENCESLYKSHPGLGYDDFKEGILTYTMASIGVGANQLLFDLLLT